MSSASGKLGFNATWSMAVGGMVGGGIFATLGVVVNIAGAWAWLSLVIAGILALAAGYSYVKLAEHYQEGGGAFSYLRKVDADSFAGSLSWILIVGYVLTNAVYAFTFGEYLGHVFNLGPWFVRISAVAVVALFVLVNLRGVGEAGGVEVFLVWFKLFVLIGLAALGLAQWAPGTLTHETSGSLAGSVLLGAASVFMAYEGFQLLAYDYEDIRNPDKTLPRAVLSAIVVVTFVYVIVALGTVMLVGAEKVIENQEVVLAIAGQQALGTTGLILVTIAAAFSTGSAINSTLFATARLSHVVARDGELPAALAHRNHGGIPDRAVIGLGAMAATLAAVGKLSTLVEAGSLAFLFTFCVVCALAFREKVGQRWFTGMGALGAGAAAVTLAVKLAFSDPMALGFLAFLAAVAIFGRPILLRHLRTRDSD